MSSTPKKRTRLYIFQAILGVIVVALTVALEITGAPSALNMTNIAAGIAAGGGAIVVAFYYLLKLRRKLQSTS
jgi:uncharacterized membrane-anchored protein